MSDALGAQEIWVVSGPTAGEPHPDYACSNREGAMEHAAEASERAPELGPWTVARYVRADLALRDVPRERNRSFWVCERFENGKSAGYWDGGSSRSFVPDIDKAIQFCRKEDVFWVTGGWHWKDTKQTEHLYIAAAPQERSDAQRDDDARPEADPQVDNSYTGQIARLRADCAARQDAARRQWEAQDANYREKCAECESLRASLQAEGRDAARYRFLCDAAAREREELAPYQLIGQLDAAIDEAMNAPEPNGGADAAIRDALDRIAPIARDLGMRKRKT